VCLNGGWRPRGCFPEVAKPHQHWIKPHFKQISNGKKRKSPETTPRSDEFQQVPRTQFWQIDHKEIQNRPRRSCILTRTHPGEFARGSMYAGLYISALLSMLPLSLTVLAWRAQNDISPRLSRPRAIAFSAGLLASLMCAVTSVCCWLEPFPLASDGHGGYSDVNEVLFAMALATALLTFVLAFFGRCSPRLLLCGAAVIQFVIAFLAILQNGV